MAPSCENELRDMLRAAIDMPGPVAVRYPRANALECELNDKPQEMPIGIPLILETGSDILLLGVGTMLQELKKTAAILRENGKNPSLVDARFVKPLDETTYKDLFDSHSIIITLEDNSVVGGYGSAIAEFLSDNAYRNHQLIRFGLPDDFVEHGEVPDLYKLLKIDGESVAQQIMEIL
jgi:1-deoxy-D-xylulose-5-phosphate synthase